MHISVLICAHNPRADYLGRVLHSLRAQTLPLAQWELLLIDNASKVPLSTTADLAWHPSGRHVREEELGLTPARLRGVREAQGELLVFVDDDNVLQPDFLEIAAGIARDWPQLGTWGGRVQPEFEQPPEEWTRPLWGLLAIREVTQDYWSNVPDLSSPAMPCGAGLCIRRSLALDYAQQLRNDGVRRKLDRRGAELTSCGDSDLVLNVYARGFGSGVFARLKLTHLIPPVRVTEAYFLRLIEGMEYSRAMLNEMNGARENSFSLRFPWLAHLSYWARFDARTRRRVAAALRGKIRADREIRRGTSA